MKDAHLAVRGKCAGARGTRKATQMESDQDWNWKTQASSGRIPKDTLPSTPCPTKTGPQSGLQPKEAANAIARTQGCEQTSGEATQDRHRKGKGDTLDRGERRHTGDTRMAKERRKNDRRKDKRKTARMAKAGQWKEAGQTTQGQTTNEDRTQPKAEKRTSKPH